ncbi:uncharacterized protein FYW61_011506 [Anableps anableps]
MSSVQHLREFIRERLAAAAEEIFTEVEKTIVRYEEQLDGQRRMMGIDWKPQIKLSRIGSELQRQGSGLQKPRVSVEKEASSIQQVCQQGRRSGHDQEEPEPQWTEEDHMEPDPMQWIKEEEEDTTYPLMDEQNEEPKSSSAKEQQKKTEPRLIEDLENPDAPRIKEEEEKPEPPLSEEQKHPETKQIKQEPEHLPARQDQTGVCSRQEGEQLVQKQLGTSMGTFILQGGDLNAGEPRTEQLSFHLSPVVGSKDQGRSSATASKNQSRTDTKNMSLKCDLCGRSLKNKYTLKVHYKTHSGQRPFSCDTCGKGFSVIGNLKVHKKIHTDERPFSCETCGKRYITNSGLNVHRRNHTGERPYSCETCGKSFTRHSILTSHKKVHMGRPLL